MKAARIVLALGTLALTASPGPAQPPLADKLPGHTLVYVGWAGRSLPFDGSILGQALAEEETKQFFRALKQVASAGLCPGKDEQSLLEHLWALGGMAWEHPCAAAVFDVASAGPAGSGAEAAPTPAGVLLVDLQKDRGDFNRQFQAMLAVARQQVKITPAAAGDVSYHRFDTRAGPCGVGLVGDVFFVALGDKAPEAVAALLGGKGEPLGKKAEFVAAMKAVAGEQVQMAFYADPAGACGLMERLCAGASPATAPATAPARASRFCRLLKQLGIDRATALAAAGSIVDRGLHEKLRLFIPKQRRSGLMALAGEALPATALAGAPADADLVLTCRADLGKTLDEIARLAAAGRGPARDLQKLLALARQRLGTDVEKDLLAHLGDHWTVVSAACWGGLGAGTVLSVSVGDEAKLRAALGKLEAALKGEGGGGGRRFDVVSVKAGEVEVRYLAVVGQAPRTPVAPAWAVDKQRLYVAAYPQVLVSAMAGGGEKPLAEMPAFAALRKRVHARPSALMYVNAPHLLRSCYGLLLADWTARANALAAEAPAPRLTAAMFPPLSKLQKHTWPVIAAVTADGEGITIESYNSLPGAGLLGLASPLPAMAAERLFAALAAPGVRRARAAENLRAVGKACRAYAAENKSQFPPDLLRLVDSGHLSAAALASPAAGRERRPTPPAGQIDYVYLAAMMTTKTPADLVVAYERPEIYRGRGSHVLLVSGEVKWLAAEPLQAELDRTRKYLEDQGK